MKSKKLKVIYEDESVLVIDKPAGVVADDIPKRVHRLDKDTSGILLVAKNDRALEFLQRQFQERKVEKKYILLIIGKLKIKEGKIETLLGRAGKDKRKQKVLSHLEPKAKGKTLRKAITEYRVIKEFKDYSLIEAFPKTGRKHQIRVHFAHLGHPIIGDKLYGFKNLPCPKGLKRQFLHANYLKIKLPDGKEKEFYSELPNDLEEILKKIEYD